MTQRRPLRFFFFVDGFTLKKVNEFYRYHHPYHAKLDFRALKNLARREAVRVFAPGEKYVLMESHYYHPYKDPSVYGGTHGISCFERELRFAGFQLHYRDRVDEDGVRPNMNLLEDAMTFASYNKMDGAVLLSTQGQYAPFPNRLRMMGLPTLLLGWNFSYTKNNRHIEWKTDSYLQSLFTYYISMDCVADRGATLANGGLFCVD